MVTDIGFLFIAVGTYHTGNDCAQSQSIQSKLGKSGGISQNTLKVFGNKKTVFVMVTDIGFLFIAVGTYHTGNDCAQSQSIQNMLDKSGGISQLSSIGLQLNSIKCPPELFEINCFNYHEYSITLHVMCLNECCV